MEDRHLHRYSLKGRNSNNAFGNISLNRDCSPFGNRSSYKKFKYSFGMLSEKCYKKVIALRQLEVAL